MSSSSPSISDNEPAPRPPRAVLVSADPSRTLAALGTAFEDLAVVGSGHVSAELERLAGTSDPIVLVVDGPVAAEVAAAVVGHVLARPERLLALAVPEEPAPLGGPAYAGLELVGAGRLGALPVTWWSADPSSGLSRVPRISTGTGGAGGPASVDPDTFAAQAQLLRADLDPEPAPDATPEPQPAPEAGSTPAPATTSPRAERPRARRPDPAAPRLRHRVAIAGALVAAGVVAGAAVARLGTDVVGGLALLGIAVILLVALSGVVALRALVVELRAQAAGTRRLRKHLDRGLSQLAGRVQSSDAKLSRMRATLRQVEARVAVVSSARVDVDRRAATDEVERPR